MLSWIVLFVVLACLTVIGTYVFGLIFGRGEMLPPIDDPDTLQAANVAAIDAKQPERIRFELSFRGYRPEQVDAVIAELTERLRQAQGGESASKKD
ncbi:DivIVA domain-containing protein [Corynebacterium uterequi]|uniref:DivIVA domain n=1 Tax=Corynebacterium uterequi TaxID=1072256 RepID=A0A0G3HFU5_9CORY|nr:DivIVA domain-containing protein [Corynebacterium uterequi]AKK10828.1 DivIVA domain [Corynebacterium uterequi]